MINDASVVIGGGNWGIKEADVLGYKLINSEYYARDIDFANSTAAGTYTDSTGVIRKAPYNLAQYSEMFADAYWTKTASVTENTDAAPNGTLTADTFTDASNAYLDVRRSFTITASTAYTFSIFVKKTTGTLTNYPGVGFSAGGGVATGYAIFNTTTGAVNLADVAGGFVLSAKSTSYGDYYRFEMTFTTAQTSLIILIYPALSQNGTTLSSNAQGSNVFWGAQFVEGTEALPYFPTTTRLNVPRIDYRNADGSLSTVGRLLLEPQRTNVALQSETITAATGTTVTLDTTTAPTGLNTADKLVEDTSTGLHFTSFGGVLGGTADSSIYCVSIFAKAAGRTRFVLFDNAQVAAGATNFDLSNGTVISGTGRIENYGNGWYRCTIFPAKSTSTTANVQIRMIDAGTNTSYTGDGTSGLFLWGKQIEPSATYQTTYIPTTTAAVTRNADVASKTGVSSWIGQEQGTLFCEVNIRANKDSVRALQVSDGTLNNRIQLAFNANNFTPAIVTGGVSQASFTVPFSVGNNKVAIGYASNDVVVYLNGVQVGSDTSATIPACSLLDVGQSIGGTNTLGDTIAQAALFTTRLDNTTLVQLTTL